MAKRRQRRGPEDRKKAILLLPLTYNDGSRIARARLLRIYEEIYVAFGGWTIEGIVTGAYRMQSGSKRVEKHSKVSIVLPATDLPLLQRLVARWCALLEQESLYLEVADSVVQFIAPSTAEESP